MGGADLLLDAPVIARTWRARLLRGIGLVGLFVLLTLVFIVGRFPVDPLAGRVATAISGATGARVSIRSLDTDIGLLGPGLVAQGVDMTLPDGLEVRMARAYARPAWSLSWLRGEPAVALELQTNLGELDGTAQLGSEPGFAGAVRGLEPSRIPALQGAAEITGKFDADIDVHQVEGEWVGTLALTAADGSIGVPGLPIGLPFEALMASLVLGGEQQVVIESLSLDGPMLAVTGSGHVGQSPSFALSPLSLALEIEARDPNVANMLRGQGLPLRDGEASALEIGGTVGQPAIGGTPAPRARGRRNR